MKKILIGIVIGFGVVLLIRIIQYIIAVYF